MPRASQPSTTLAEHRLNIPSVEKVETRCEVCHLDNLDTRLGDRCPS